MDTISDINSKNSEILIFVSVAALPFRKTSLVVSVGTVTVLPFRKTSLVVSVGTVTVFVMLFDCERIGLCVRCL